MPPPHGPESFDHMPRHPHPPGSDFGFVGPDPDDLAGLIPVDRRDAASAVLAGAPTEMSVVAAGIIGLSRQVDRLIASARSLLPADAAGSTQDQGDLP